MVCLTRQFTRFALVGALATVCHLGMLTLLVEVLGQDPLPASIAGFILAVVLSYIFNCRWTFDAGGSHKKYFPKYMLTCIVGFMLNISIMYVTVVLWQWWYINGQLTALCVVPITNFLLNRYWVFGNKDKEFGFAAKNVG